MITLLPRDDIGFPDQILSVKKTLKLTSREFSVLLGIARVTFCRYSDRSRKDFSIPTVTIWNRINKKLGDIKYFEKLNDGTIDTLVKKTEEKTRYARVIIDSPYKTFWQPIKNESNTIRVKCNNSVGV